MKTILVSTDFSKAAKVAAEYAVNISKVLKANVILMHSYYYPIYAPDGPVMVLTEEDIEKESVKFLKKEALRLKNKTGKEVKFIAKMGFATDVILQESAKADLVVMGMKGANKLSEAVLGSTATEVIRKSTKPVMIIPEKYEYTKPKKIVFAFDYDPRSDLRSLGALGSITEAFKSKVYIVNIVKEAKPSQEEKKVKLKLERKLKNTEHFYYFPVKDDVQNGINGFISENNADLIAIIPHKYSFIERLFHKSVSRKVAFHTKIPMLCLPDNHKSVPAYFI